MVMVPVVIEQQAINVARSFHRLAAHREHVMLHHAIHTRDAYRRKQSADRGRESVANPTASDQNPLTVEIGPEPAAVTL